MKRFKQSQRLLIGKFAVEGPLHETSDSVSSFQVVKEPKLCAYGVVSERFHNSQNEHDISTIKILIASGGH